jgi:hypothetical protein
MAKPNTIELRKEVGLHEVIEHLPLDQQAELKELEQRLIAEAKEKLDR